MRKRLESWADYFGGVGLALLAVTGIFYLMKQPNERLMIIAALGAVFLGLYVWARPQQVRAAVTSREARYGTNAVVVTLAFLGLVVLANFMSGRYNARYDSSANKSNTLSELTIKTLQELKEPVKATAFYSTLRAPTDNSRRETEDRLKEYARYGDRLTYRLVDPEAELQLANEYQAFDGMIVFERGARRENALRPDEESLTNAILKVSQDKQPALYFTTGHGERSLDDSSDNGYSVIKAALETDNYSVATLNLKTITDTLPADLVALVIAGPRQKFDADELQRVTEYLDKNGRVFIMVDPQTDTGLEPILKAWGLSLRNDTLIDPKLALQGQVQVPVISAYKSHEVTKDLTGLGTFFTGVRTLSADSPPPAGRFAAALFASSDASWGETDLAGLQNQKVAFDANSDAKGPLDLAFAVEASGGSGGRLVVFGNSTFVSNSRLRVQAANPLLFGNAIHWLAGQENLIAIPPKLPSSARMLVSAEQSNFIFLSSFLFLPGALLLIGAIVWWRRR